MRKEAVFTVAAILTVMLTNGCGDKYNVEKRPRVLIKVNNVEIHYNAEQDSYQFPTVSPNEGVVSMGVEVLNQGDAPLTVQQPFIQGSASQGEANRDVTLDWSQSYITEWPHRIVPGIDGEAVRFDVKYTPQEPMDDTPTKVLIQSDDYYGQGNIELTFETIVAQPALRVYPTKHTFMNATRAIGEPVTIQIDNDGSLSLRIESITLEGVEGEGFCNDNPGEFCFVDKPDAGTEILPAGTPNYERLQFTVRYQPADPADPANPDQSKVLIQSNDPATPVFEIPLSVSQQTGRYEISYEDQALRYLNFADQNTPLATATKTITVSNLAGSIQFRQARITPPAAAARYSLTIQRPATSPDGEPQVLCGPDDPSSCPSPTHPVGIQEGRSLDILVTYTAPEDPVEAGLGVDGMIALDMATPAPVTESIPMMAGNPKAQFDLGPHDRAIHLYAASGQTQSGVLAIYNNGNADLQLDDVTLTDKWGAETPNFTADPVLADQTVIPPFGLQLVTIRFAPDATLQDTAQALYTIRYTDPLSGQMEAAMNVFGYTQTLEGRPVAVPGTYVGAQVGVPVVLDAGGSAGGDYQLAAQGYQWYLTQKPLGSLVALNVSGGMQTQFVADRPGTYGLRLFVYGLQGSDFVFSDQVSVDIVVAE